MVKTKRQGGGAKLARSETVTVRLDPKLRYLAGLAASKQRRTLSSYIEWAVEDSLKRVALRGNGDKHVTVADMAEKLWDVDEGERFVRLAFRYPELLNHEDEKLWKVIRQCGALWLGRWQGDAFLTVHDEDHVDFAAVREHWELLCLVARGEADESALPRRERPGPPMLKDGDPIPF